MGRLGGAGGGPARRRRAVRRSRRTPQIAAYSAERAAAEGLGGPGGCGRGSLQRLQMGGPGGGDGTEQRGPLAPAPRRRPSRRRPGPACSASRSAASAAAGSPARGRPRRPSERRRAAGRPITRRSSSACAWWASAIGVSRSASAGSAAIAARCRAASAATRRPAAPAGRAAAAVVVAVEKITAGQRHGGAADHQQRPGAQQRFAGNVPVHRRAVVVLPVATGQVNTIRGRPWATGVGAPPGPPAGRRVTLCAATGASAPVACRHGGPTGPARTIRRRVPQMTQRGRATRPTGPSGRPRRADGARGGDACRRTRGGDLARPARPAARVIEPVVDGAGYDLEDLSVSRAGRRHVVRVIVDADGGINLDAVADVSRAVSAALDAAEEAGGDLVAGEYQLEVSSPGRGPPAHPAPALAAQRRPAGQGDRPRHDGAARAAARRGPAGHRPGGRGRRRARGAGDRRRPRGTPVRRARPRPGAGRVQPSRRGRTSRTSADDGRSRPTNSTTSTTKMMWRTRRGEHRPRGAARTRARAGDPVRHDPRGDRDRVADRLPAHRRRRAARPGGDRPQVGRRPGLRPGAGRRRQRGAGVGRHPARLRPDRRHDRQAGDPPAAAGGHRRGALR